MTTSDIVLIVFFAFISIIYLAFSKVGRALIRGVLSRPLERKTIEVEGDDVRVKRAADNDAPKGE